jgi:hypothetical protein
VVTSHDIIDYEPIFAIRAFFTAKRVQNPLFLQTPEYRIDTPLAQNLAKTLYDMSRLGLSGFEPLARLPAEPLPMGVGLSGAPPDAYENLGILWPMVPR